MLNKISKFSLVAALATVPFWVNAEQLGQTETFFENAQDIITGILIPLVFALALLFFFYGVAKYIWSAGTDKDEGKKIMVWGVIALFVMTSIWGIVKFIEGEFLPGASPTSVTIPTIQ